MDILPCADVGNARLTARAVGVEYHFSLSLRLEDYVVLSTDARKGRQREGRITSGRQTHNQAVVHSAADQCGQEFLDGVEVGVLATDVSHAAHRSLTDNEHRADCIVQRFMVTESMASRSQRVLHPHFQVVESGHQRHILCDGHLLHSRVARQTATPVIITMDGVVDAVADSDGIGCQRSEVHQFHLDAVVVGSHRNQAVGSHQAEVLRRTVRDESHIVQQRLAGIFCHHHRRPHIPQTVAGVELCTRKGVIVHRGLSIECEDTLLRRQCRDGLHRHPHSVVARSVIDNLHHQVLAGIIERVEEIYRNRCPRRARGYRQLPVVHLLHERRGERYRRRIVRRHGVVRLHIFQLEHHARTRPKGAVRLQREAHRRDAAGSIPRLRHQRRVKHPLALVVRIARKGEVIVATRTHKAGSLHSQLVFAATHKAELQPAVLRHRVARPVEVRVVVRRSITCRAVELHQRVVTVERYHPHETSFHPRHRHHPRAVHRRIAPLLIVQPHRVAIHPESSSIAHRIQHHSCLTRVRVVHKRRITVHRYRRLRQRLRTRHHSQVVNPPATGVAAMRLLSDDELQRQLSLRSRHRLADDELRRVVHVETLALPLLVARRHILPIIICCAIECVAHSEVGAVAVRSRLVVVLLRQPRPVARTLSVPNGARRVARCTVLLHRAQMVKQQRNILVSSRLRKIKRSYHQLHILRRRLVQLQRPASNAVVRRRIVRCRRRGHRVVRLTLASLEPMFHLYRHLSLRKHSAKQKNDHRKEKSQSHIIIYFFILYQFVTPYSTDIYRPFWTVQSKRKYTNIFDISALFTEKIYLFACDDFFFHYPLPTLSLLSPYFLPTLPSPARRGARGPYRGGCRCSRASYMKTPAATLTFSELTSPTMGSLARTSLIFRSSVLIPVSSLPMMSRVG